MNTGNIISETIQRFECSDIEHIPLDLIKSESEKRWPLEKIEYFGSDKVYVMVYLKVLR